MIRSILRNHLRGYVALVAKRRFTTGATPGASLAAFRTVRGAMVGAGAIAGVVGNGLNNEDLFDFCLAERFVGSMGDLHERQRNANATQESRKK